MANSVCYQPIGDTPRSGSPLTRCGRSSVVFTEGADSSPTDWGNVSEACESGGLGTLAVALTWMPPPAREVVLFDAKGEGFDDLIGR